MQIQRNDANSAKWMQIQRSGCKFSETDANSAFRMQIQGNGCKFRETDANSAKRSKFCKANANSAKRMQIQRNGCKFSETDANSAARIEQGLGPTEDEPAISHTSQPGLQAIISSTLQLPGIVAPAADLFSLATTLVAGAATAAFWRAQLATCHAASKLDEKSVIAMYRVFYLVHPR
jgi:hypothetical protein